MLLSITFFGILYFLTKPMEKDASIVIPLAIVFVLSTLAIMLFAIQNRLIATEFIASEYDEEPFSFSEILYDCQGYVIPYSVLVFVYLLSYNLIIPFIGSLAGGIFQISLFDLDFNILTLIINLVLIAWVFLGTAQIVTVEATLSETIGYTTNFIFDNFGKMIIFFIIIIGLLFTFQFILVSTYTADQTYAIPIKVLAFAYLFSVCNAYTISFFANNASIEEEAE